MTDRVAYLEHTGAVVLGGVAERFGGADAVAGELRALTAGAGLTDLSSEARFDVAGADAPDFLHRLLTANVKHLAPGAGSHAFLLTGTGRIVLPLLVLRANEARYELCAPAALQAVLLAELDRYLFSERVEISPMGALRALMSVQGPEAGAVVARAGLSPPEAPLAHAEGHLAGLPVRVLRHDRFDAPGYDVFVPASDFEAAWGALVGAGARPSGRLAAEMARVLAGACAWGHEWTPETSPTETSGLLGITEGKGCYPGQEVIERTLALGAPPRALIRLQAEGALVPGDPVLAAGAEIGHVTSAATLPDGRHLGLALVKRKFAETAEPLRAGSVPARRRA